MKQNKIGLLILLGAVIIFFYQFLLLGKLPIPSDTITGLYHPFRDFYSSEYPNGMPYKNFLITDPVRQQFPWRHLAVESIGNYELPLWNPYNFTGTPLLANFQNGAFYPLNILFLFLPFEFSWSILILLQSLLGAVFIYFFLKNKKIDSTASAIAGVAFTFSGFSISWMEWNTVVQVAIWLPLILLAKDQLLKKFSWKWTLVLIFAECSAILAGHLQVLFYLWTVSISYLFLRILQLSWNSTSKKASLMKMVKKTLPFLPMVIFILAITSIQWLPTFNFIGESAREIDQVSWQKDGWFIPWEHLLQFVVPDFFGNPATLNYWGTWNYAELVGYIGIVPLMLALFAIFFRRSKLTLYFGTVFFLSLIFALPTFLAKLPFQLNIPLLSTSQPTRLLFLTDFALSILAGLGADYLLKKKKEVAFPIFLVGILFVILWLITLGRFEVSEKFLENISIVRSNLLFPTIIFITTCSLFAAHIFLKKHVTGKILLLGLLLLTLLDLFRFGWKFLPFTDSEYLYPSTKVTSFLQNQDGQFRIMSTDSRIMPPNFSIMYKLQTLDGYDPLYLRRYGELIAMSESGKGRVPGVLAFNRIITPHNYKSSLIDLLNVKYVLSFNEIKEDKFRLVFKEGNTLVYENTQVLPRVYFVENIIPVTFKEEAAAEIFRTNFDASVSAVVEVENIIQKIYPKGIARIDNYQNNTVSINTSIAESTSSARFLVLTDSYYPTWKVKFVKKDGSVEVGKIYRTNYNYRGVVVPSNTKEVIYINELF